MTEGFDIAKAKALQVLEEVKISKDVDRDTLISVARTSLRTKVNSDLADHLTEVGVKYIEIFLGKLSVFPNRVSRARLVNVTTFV